jgi:hypothetical protein
MAPRRRFGHPRRARRRRREAGRDRHRNHHLFLGSGIGVRRAGQRGRGDADRRPERARRHRRRAGSHDLHRRGRGQRARGLRVPSRGPGRGRGRDAGGDFEWQLQPGRPARRGPQGAQHHVGLRHPADLRGRRLSLRFPHPGERYAGDGGDGTLSAQDQTRLPDHRGDQPGLCLGAGLLGHLLQNPESVEAGRRDRGRAVSEIRRARLLDRDHAPVGAAPRCRALNLMGRRSRHPGAPGGAARPVRAEHFRLAAGGELVAAAR